MTSKNSANSPDSARTAAEIAAAVSSGKLDPTVPVRDALHQIEALDAELNAFVTVLADFAIADAEALRERPDLSRLPLAGVPIGIKSNIDGDHPVVHRLKAAGAIVVGYTSAPECCIFPMTDTGDRITRNPWNRDLTAGGSSGGSGAAVASGMVPIAHGNDGFGSIRIPAAACGLFGIKPGFGVVPAEVGPTSWGGLAENGVLATTVADAALALSVMADRPDLALPTPPSRLRIGLDVHLPSMAMVRGDRHWRAAARVAGSVAVAAGHFVESAALPYPSGNSLLPTWTTAAAKDAVGVRLRDLERRNRTHLRIGRLLRKLGVTGPERSALTEKFGEFFADYDLVITPTLAKNPPKARSYSRASWFANFSAARYSPLTPVWNMLGWPAAAIPMGRHPDGSPMSVQIAGPPGSEATILGLAAQIESRHPWPVVAF